MALRKEVTLSTGVKAEYHRITLVRVNYSEKSVTFEVSSYITKDAREAGFDPVYVKSHIASTYDAPEDIRPWLYGWLSAPLRPEGESDTVYIEGDSPMPNQLRPDTGLNGAEAA